jgi:asparagine synthase (glutamine-hydrolysing)
MDRFVAMVWDQADPSRHGQVNAWSETLQRQSSKWKRVLDQPGLRVFSYHHRGDGPVVTRWQDDNGIVIGALFERGQEKKGRVQSLDSHAAGRVITSRGDELIRGFWGNYVAIWRDPETRNTTVLRDPCGAVPCFMTERHGVELLFAHAEDVADLPGLNFTIDWTYLQAFILFNYFVTKYTGLKEVTELLGGERLECRPGSGKKFSWAWNGAEIAAEPDLQTFADAKAELRSTAEACFTAWGKEYRNIVVSLSGGLDSSIVLNLLRRTSDARITGLHFLGVGYEQYEVQLARMAAANADAEYVEGVLNPKQDEVRRILNSPRMARPKMQSMAILVDDLSTALADRVGADAFMTGQGGDNLFLQRGGATRTVADYVRLNGFGRDFWRVAYDAAKLQRHTIWKVAGDALHAAISPHGWRPYEFLQDEGWAKHRAISPGAIDATPASYKLHPWLAQAARTPPNKAGHLVSIVGLYNYHSSFGRGVTRDVILPFFSQPIAELALRTPTYVLAEGGLDRALQRRAFADIIPEPIARRTGKGGAGSYYLQVTQNNLDLYRELILDGAMVRQGWLDRDKIERMLTPDHIVHGGGSMFIDLLVVAEGWVKSWINLGVRAAA